MLFLYYFMNKLLNLFNGFFYYNYGYIFYGEGEGGRIYIIVLLFIFIRVFVIYICGNIGIFIISNILIVKILK